MDQEVPGSRPGGGTITFNVSGSLARIVSFIFLSGGHMGDKRSSFDG